MTNLKPIDVREELATASGLSTGTLTKVQAVLNRGDESTKAAMLAPQDDPKRFKAVMREYVITMCCDNFIYK